MVTAAKIVTITTTSTTATDNSTGAIAIIAVTATMDFRSFRYFDNLKAKTQPWACAWQEVVPGRHATSRKHVLREQPWEYPQDIHLKHIVNISGSGNSCKIYGC